MDEIVSCLIAILRRIRDIEDDKKRMEALRVFKDIVIILYDSLPS